MAGATLKSLSTQDYTVACICPLPVEITPVLALRDEEHGQPHDLSFRSQNAYQFGTIGQHNVVVANTHQVGIGAAAIVAEALLNDFTHLRFTLLVGIGGGVPGGSADIRLGDVVVSQSQGSFSGVVQYDLGKKVDDGFQRTGQLNQPPRILTNHVLMLQAVHSYSGSKIREYLDVMEKNDRMRDQYTYPGQDTDHLYEITYHHIPGQGCEQCDPTERVSREARSTNEPYIHYGSIGSANAVVKSAVDREKLRQDLGIICLEMEAAGIMNNLPCLVIRGICDYADSHKNDAWRGYAAAVAAAYMKELLTSIPSQQMTKMPHSSDSAAAAVNQLAPASTITQASVRRPSILLQAMRSLSQSSFGLSESPIEGENRRGLPMVRPVPERRRENLFEQGHAEWDLIYDNLRVDDPSAAALLRLLGYYENTDLWYDIVCLNKQQAALSLKSKVRKSFREMSKMVRKASQDTSQRLSELIGNLESFERSIKVLIEKKFITEPYKGQYRFLPGVHEWNFRRAGTSVDSDYYWFAFDCIAGLIKGIEKKDQAYIENDACAFHAAKLMHEQFDLVGKDIDPTRLNAGDTVASFLTLHIRDDAAAELYHRVLTKAKTTWGLQDQRTADLYADLGQVYMDQGEYLKAKKMLKSALRIIESHNKPQSAQTLQAISDVAWAYSMLNKFDKADRQFEQANRQYEKLLKMNDETNLDDRQQLLMTRFPYLLGQYYFRRGEFNAAESLVEQSLSERTRLLGPVHRTTVATLTYLGHIYFQHEELAEAVMSYNRAVDASIKCYGFEHPRTIYTSLDLASVYLEQYRLVDAERLLSSLRAAIESLTIVTKGSPAYDLYSVLGCLFIKQGELIAAEQMLLQALAGQEKRCGPNHISVMWTRNHIGALYLEQGKLKEAEIQYQKVIAFCDEHRTPNHRITRKAQQGLTLVQQKQYQTSEVFELGHGT